MVPPTRGKAYAGWHIRPPGVTVEAFSVWAALAILLLSATSVTPVVNDAEGRRAFADLANYYVDRDAIPPYAAALDSLPFSPAAGRYVLRLFEQSLADEANGRAASVPTPYWGGGAESAAREFRSRLAGAFGRGASGDASLPALEWLLLKEPVLDIQEQGAEAMILMRHTVPEELIARALRQPNAGIQALKRCTDIARTRHMVALAPDLQKLMSDPRSSLRDGASSALHVMGIQPDTSAKILFPSWLGDELRACAARVRTAIPDTARWAVFHVTTNQMWHGELYVARVHGWLLGEDGGYRVLDEFGRERTFPRATTRVANRPLAEEVSRFLYIRSHATSGVAESLSVEGGLTGQFEPESVSLPEILVATWSFVRGDTASAAAILYPRLEAVDRPDLLRPIARDLLGNRYHIDMLQAFSFDRDYAKTMALADHLSRPLFDGYPYQPRARELRAQLATRGSDFGAFALPDSVEWLRLKRGMGRPQQIFYLCEHLRLLNCFQLSQPGEPHLRETQYEKAWHVSSTWDEKANTSRRLINPYVELEAMHLEPADLPIVAPFLADVQYMPTFGFWREFYPDRDLYRVCDVLPGIVNSAAKQELVGWELPSGDAQRKELVHSVAEWGRTHAGKSPDDLGLEFLRATKEGYKFAAALGKVSGDPHVSAIVHQRIDEFPHDTGDILRILSRSDGDAYVDLARRKLHECTDVEADEFRRTTCACYAAVILLRHGDPEGLATARRLVAGDRDGYWTRELYPALIASKDPEARTLACEAVRPRSLLLKFENSEMLRKAVKSGCEGVADSLLALLASTKPTGASSTAWDAKRGEDVRRELVEGDLVAYFVADWRKNGPRYDMTAPDEERARQRSDLARWLAGEARK